jgi:hypothetical protein
VASISGSSIGGVAAYGEGGVAACQKAGGVSSSENRHGGSISSISEIKSRYEIVIMNAAMA